MNTTEIEKLLEKLNKEIDLLPAYALRTTKDRGKYKYYFRDEHSKLQYIKRDNIGFAKQLAQREYDISLRNSLLKLLQAKKQYKNALLQYEISSIFNNMCEGRKNLVDSHGISDEQYVNNWQSQKYQGKLFDDNACEIYSEKGERVRSKSEKIIADKLYYMGIPYHYEKPLYLKGFGTVYPDFTVLNVATRREMYWEHFGMMDNLEYLSHALAKIETFQNNDIFSGINLIITHETSRQPLSSRMLEKIIYKYLL